jgi:hypothetical protein
MTIVTLVSGCGNAGSYLLSVGWAVRLRGVDPMERTRRRALA